MKTRTRPLATAVHHALTSSAPTSAPPQGGFSLVETIVTAALVSVLAAGVYTVYQPTSGLAQVQTQTALLDQLKTGVERSFGSSANFSNVSFSASGSSGGNQQSSAPNWVPSGLTTVTNWGAISIGPAQTNVANDSWKVSFPTVPTRDCQQSVIHELNNWSAITVNGTLVSDAQSTIDACSSTTNGQNVVAFVDYQGPLASAGNAFALPPGAGQPYNPPPGAPTPPVIAPNPGPATAPTQSKPITPPVGAAATPSPSGPGVAMPPPPGTAPTPSYPATCVVPSAQSQTLTCPAGQLGSILQARTASCPNPYGTAVWGAWTTTSNTCTPACVAPPSGTGTQTASCPSGQVTSTGASTVSQSQTISYTCPAPTGTYTTVYGAWSPALSSACAPKCVAPAPSTNTQTASCPAGQVTSAGASTFTQTQPVSYSCASPQGAYTTTPGAWSPAATSVCAPKCVAPGPQTQTVACPAGQLQNASPYGTNGITQTRTASCPTPTGAVVWSGWTTTANSCTPACVAPPPNVGTGNCSDFNNSPAGATYGGTYTVQSNATCTTPVGPVSWGPVYTVSSSCYINNYCSAPGATSVTQYQTLYNTCVAPLIGNRTLYQSRTATTTYTCASPYGSSYNSSVSYTPWSTYSSSGSCQLACVSVESFVYARREGIEQHLRAGEVVVGDELALINPKTGIKRWGKVTYSKAADKEGVRLTTRSGLTLTCSESAPIGITEDVSEDNVLSVDALHRTVAVEDYGVYAGEEVVDVKPLGMITVQHITCENDFFLAGDECQRYMAHHNMKPPPQ